MIRGVQPMTSIPACLALTICPNCGYSLEGLASEGACPECGRTYAPGEIVLYGYGRGQHENVRTTRPRRVVWIWFCSACLLFFQLLWTFSWFGRAGSIFLLALVAAPSGYLYLRR